MDSLLSLQKLLISLLSLNIPALMFFFLTTNYTVNQLDSFSMKMVNSQIILVLLTLIKPTMMQKTYSVLTLIMTVFRDVMLSQLIEIHISEYSIFQNWKVLLIIQIFTKIFILKKSYLPTPLILLTHNLYSTEMVITLFQNLDKLPLIQNKTVMAIFNFSHTEKLAASPHISPRW